MDCCFKVRVRVRVSGPTFDTLCMVRVRFRVIIGYGVTLNMSTAIGIQLQTVFSIFSSTLYLIRPIKRKDFF